MNLKTLIAKMRKNGPNKTSSVPHNLSDPPTAEDVRQGFRFILGRELNNDRDISAQLRRQSVAEFRLSLLKSEEFQAKYKVIHPGAGNHPDLSRQRDTLVFIHLEKTGGNTLRNYLEGKFPSDRVCPARFNELHLYTAAELGFFDFFAGHFDRSSIRLIPRDNIKIVSLFREPRSRLISLYRFFKSHTPNDEFADATFVRLANELTVEEFFERPEVRSTTNANNHYTVHFGGSLALINDDRHVFSKDGLSRALEDAKRQISALASIGITERFDQSVKLICKELNLPPPPPIEALYVTDKMPEVDPRFRRVGPVGVTPRLAAALEDLTVYDDEIYRFAVSEFDRRCAALNIFQA
jgi:hypothetical protein